MFWVQVRFYVTYAGGINLFILSAEGKKLIPQLKNKKIAKQRRKNIRKRKKRNSEKT